MWKLLGPMVISQNNKTRAGEARAPNGLLDLQDSHLEFQVPFPLMLGQCLQAWPSNFGSGMLHATKTVKRQRLLCLDRFAHDWACLFACLFACGCMLPQNHPVVRTEVISTLKMDEIYNMNQFRAGKSPG